MSLHWREYSRLSALEASSLMLILLCVYHAIEFYYNMLQHCNTFVLYDIQQ